MPDDAEHSYRSSRTMAADADIVLNTAADPTRAAAWLPEGLQVVDSGTDTLDVNWNGGVHRYEVHLSPAEHRLEWRPVDHDGWTGELRVTDKGAGSSEAELRVDTDGRGGDVGPVLDQALDGLAVEVDQNFTVG
jgi:hypothetical protein